MKKKQNKFINEFIEGNYIDIKVFNDLTEKIVYLDW